MKRHSAQNINKCTKEINAQLKATYTNVSDVGDKLLKDNELTLQNIYELGQCIAEQQGYDKNQLIVCYVTELKEQLKLHKGDDITEKPIFIICHNEQSTKAAICIVKLLDKIVCLYKDFLDIQIPADLKDILGQYFGRNIEFKINAEMVKSQDKKNQAVFLSLKTLETMMIYLKPDKRKDFIEGFANSKENFFAWLKNEAVHLKDELFSLLKEGYYRTVASDLDELSKDAAFKKAIKSLIHSVSLKEEVDNFKIYQTLLKEFVEIEENEINIDAAKIKELEKQLKQAREHAFSNIKDLKIETSQNEKGDRQLDIVKKFPTQMEKVTKLFQLLMRSKVDDKLDEILKKISLKLDLEYDKLKNFFRITEETKQDDYYTISSIENIKDVANQDHQSSRQSKFIHSLFFGLHLALNIFFWILQIFNFCQTLFINALPKLQSNESNLISTNKTFEQLLSEIIIEKSDVLNIESLKEGYNKVKIFSKLWYNKEAFKINQWAVSKKGQLTDSEVYEALAIMDRANELVTGGHKLRDIQILAVLTFLQQKDKGQLSQIETGEGKTTIVSILAAISALQGKTVDVVTSNPVLASDGIKDKKHFYDLLNLSVTTNNLDESYKSGARACYKADIVYGCISNFQFDYLKDSFLGLNTRAARPFENIILDEVDSMIIDNASHIAKLSGPFPGMESLKYVYIKIWQALYKAEEEIKQEFRNKLKLKAEELQNLLDSEEAQLLYEQFENELQNSIIPKIKDYIKSSNPTEIYVIPSHIQEYADYSLDRWIDSAIDAKFTYNEDEQYVIRSKNGEKVIQPVDYANTGITLKNTIWQYGLHQFLQLKHNLHLTSENLTSCFISNLAYINKYGDKIWGLTGTLGSEAEQELLSSVYNVSYVKIPTYKEKKFIEINGEVVDDEMFSTKVADDVVFEVDNGRAALIICETIKDAKVIQKALNRKHLSIKTFFDEENAHITEEEINPGEVVLATNIAGRGTDFKTSVKLESSNGLHVCVAFLPCNKRVEDQAFGRTARQGNHGTAKLIIKKSEIEKLGVDFNNFKEIKNLRDQKEKERIQQIKEIKIPELKFQDKLFRLFSTLYRKLQGEYQNKAEYKYVLDDLKEFWAFWLDKNNFKGLELKNKSPEKEFKNFEFETKKTIKGRIQFNPYYSIQQAEYFISSGEKLNQAEQALNHAISISKNPEILHSTFIKLFEIAIEKGRVFEDKCKKAVGDVFFISLIEPDREYKENAKKYLKQAKEAFKQELDYIENLFGDEEFSNIIRSNSSNELVNIFPNEPQKRENLFLRHIVSKQQALNLNVSHIDSLVQQIDEYKDGISIGARISDYFCNLKPQNDHESKIKNTVTNSELSELAAIGANTTYALREVHDVCPEIVKGAQIQIAGGIELIAIGIAFPVALPLTSPIAGTMITEGICDIATELINKNGDGKFNKEAYVKGKVLSYSVSILTMGINAAMQCPKILNVAKKACRWISETLRRCPRLKKACEFLATKFDKLGDWFEKMETIAKFSNMSKVEKIKYVHDLHKVKDVKKLNYLGENIKQFQDLLNEFKKVGKLTELTHIEKCVLTLQQVAISTTKSVASRVVENVIMRKVITPALNSFMSGLKPIIIKHVDKAVRENINQGKLKSCTYEDIQNIIKEIRECLDYDTIKDIFKDAILGITKYCSNWRIQLGALAVDQYISWEEVYNYAKDLCEKINEKLESGKTTNQNVDALINQLIEQLSEEMYAQLLSTTIKSCKDFYSVGRSAYRNYKQEKQEEAKCLEIIKDFKEGGLAGQEHAQALSDVEKRPIHIHEENGNIVIIGEQYSGDPIKLNYFPPDENNPTGHYVPFGQSKDWSSDRKSKNNCLFDAVGSQIKKNPNELREKTIKKMESDPTRYVAPYVREISGTQTLLEGGRTNQPILEDCYPSYEDRIKVGQEHTSVLSELHNELNSYKKEYEEFCRKNLSKKLCYMKHSKSFPQFGTNPDKEEMMMGVLSVEFNDGTQLKLATVSGDSPFSVRQSVPEIKDLTLNPEPIPYNCKVKGVKFVDPGKLEGKVVYDVYNRRETNTKYTKSCCAQKLFYSLSEHLKENPKLQIKGKIKMAESWFKPHNNKFSADQIIINKSCKPCESVLLNATGGNFTGNGFNNYQEWSYWNQYSKIGIEILLRLRLDSVNCNDVVVVSPNDVYDDTLFRVEQLMNKIPEIKQDIILLPLNLYAKHWVGMIIQKNQNGINIIYMDPEQNSMPVLLKEQLIERIESNYPEHNVTLVESNFRPQRYNNCGPEVVENFINYLTGNRLPQEDAVIIHSILFENSLLLGSFLT